MMGKGRIAALRIGTTQESWKMNGAKNIFEKSMNGWEKAIWEEERKLVKFKQE